MGDTGRILHESASPRVLSNTGLLYRRNTTCCLTCYLTSAKIPKKYGLTNVMLFAASMLAYAGLDNRAVVFPEKSPVDVETLLNLDKTEALLSVVNVRFATRDEVLQLPKKLKRTKPLQKTSAWRVGIHLGYRALSGSNNPTNASIALSKLQMNMGITKDSEIVSYGDFFLRFPFYALRPLDDCFFLRRMVFSDAVLSAAMRVMAHLEHLSGGGGGRANPSTAKRVLALHLRLESDAYLLDRRIGRVPPAELQRFLREAVAPLAAQEGIGVVYVCSGPLDKDYVQVLRQGIASPGDLGGGGGGGLRVVLKDDVPGLGAELRAMAGPTTSHAAAAIDLTVMELATVAVSTSLSTFFLAVLSRRCASPRVALDVRKYATGSILFRAQPNGGSGNAVAAAQGVIPAAQRRGMDEGAFAYEMQAGATAGAAARLTALEFVGCDVPWKNHCFFGPST